MSKFSTWFRLHSHVPLTPSNVNGLALFYEVAAAETEDFCLAFRHGIFLRRNEESLLACKIRQVILAAGKGQPEELLGGTMKLRKTQLKIPNTLTCIDETIDSQSQNTTVLFKHNYISMKFRNMKLIGQQKAKYLHSLNEIRDDENWNSWKNENALKFNKTWFQIIFIMSVF